jgi:DNA (cytosine-5)-methyltransferase 1
MDPDNLRFVDICCGIGGFHQALARLGATCVLACDTDAHCRATYLENYGIEPVGDVAAIDLAALPEFDVLCAGFPCQPFAKCGAQQGYADARGQVFFRVCDLARARMPAYMIMENVRNLASHDGGNTWRVIRAAIDDIGYYTYDEPLILNVLHFNVPQNRERVVIMCKRKDLGALPDLPAVPKHPKAALTRTVADIVDAGVVAALPAKMAAVEDVWHSFVHLLIHQNIAMPKFPLWTDWWGRLAPPTLLLSPPTPRSTPNIPAG